MSAQLEPQPVCWFCGEHFRGPEIEVPGLGLLSPCPAFAPRVPHRLFWIQDWQDPAENHDPGDEDDVAERAWTAEQVAAWHRLTEEFTIWVNSSVPVLR